MADTEHWTAFVPAAARWPYEVHLYPHRRVPDLPALDDASAHDFADVYLDCCGASTGSSTLRSPTSPPGTRRRSGPDRDLASAPRAFHHPASAGKLKFLAGSESGMGVFINDVPPEDAADRLREVGP